MAVRIKCSQSGKDVYFSWTECARAAEFLMAKRDVKLRVYLCPDCRNYHLTKTGTRTTADMFKGIGKLYT